jgi:hypothetical protein
MPEKTMRDFRPHPVRRQLSGDLVEVPRTPWVAVKSITPHPLMPAVEVLLGSASGADGRRHASVPVRKQTGGVHAYDVAGHIPDRYGQWCIKGGAFQQVMEAMTNKLKPEAAYFMANKGCRCAMLFFDMQDASDVLAETRPDSRCWLFDRAEPVVHSQAAISFSFARGSASRKVCIGVLPKHQRP